MRYKIVETDNYGRDYPNEKFLNIPVLSKESAEAIAYHINISLPDDYPRYWKVVDKDYKLVPGFEP